VRFRGQDKGRGPKWPKPLSAHLFLRDARGLPWDVDSPRSPMAPKQKAGTRPEIALKHGFFAVFSRGGLNYRV